MQSQVIDHFQKNISRMFEGKSFQIYYLAPNEPDLEYLNTDVRAAGGETADSAWNRGYYLSTSIQGSKYKVSKRNQPTQSPVPLSQQDLELAPEAAGRARDINSYVNYELPKEENKPDHIQHIVEHAFNPKNGKANFGNISR
jgi:hypothetical protein